MKKFYPERAFLAAFLFFFMVACTADYRTDEEKLRELIVSNKVISVSELLTFVHGGVEEKEQLHHVKLFNEKGLIVKETVYTAFDSIERIIRYEYDSNNNLILSIGLSRDSTLLFKETRSYEGNQRKELYFYLPDGSYKYRNTASWDDKGRMTGLDWYWPQGLSARNKYAYDGRKKTEEVQYGPDNNFTYIWKFDYNADEDLVRAVQYYPDNVINGMIVYEYNGLDQVIKQTDYSGEQVQKVTTFVYSENELLESKTEYSGSGSVTARYRYEYRYYDR